MSSHFVVLATLALAILFSPETLVLGLILSSDKKVPRQAAYAFAVGAVLGITFATSIGLWIAHASGAVSASHADHTSWPGFIVRIVIAGALLVIGLYRAVNALRHKPIPDVTKADHHPGRLRTSLSRQFPKLMHSLDPKTDLPVRQTYYWPQDNGAPATAGPAMLMASYHDGSNISFWDGLRPQRRQAWSAGLEATLPDEPFVGHCDPQSNGEWCTYQAPQRMVDEVARQLAAVHDLAYTPPVQNAAFRDWGDDPYGGGWNSWNIGVKSWEIKERIVQPFENRALYICGEAYSDAQGWVEGALQTADMMLDKLGLAML